MTNQNSMRRVPTGRRRQGRARWPGTALRFIPVEHAGNTNVSAEEAECVAAPSLELLDDGC